MGLHKDSAATLDACCKLASSQALGTKKDIDSCLEASQKILDAFLDCTANSLITKMEELLLGVANLTQCIIKLEGLQTAQDERIKSFQENISSLSALMYGAPKGTLR